MIDYHYHQVVAFESEETVRQNREESEECKIKSSIKEFIIIRKHFEERQRWHIEMANLSDCLNVKIIFNSTD